MRGLGRFRRSKPAPKVHYGATQTYPASVTPPPPPPPPAAKTGTNARVRLILADGSEEHLPVDEELAARAEYLVNGILKPPPPA